jgi:hypothetical protein
MSETSLKEETPEQSKMIDEALKDTLKAIEDAATTSFNGDGIKTKVSAPAKAQWTTRYKPMYTNAVVVKGLKWDDSKEAVLDRAREVGVLAANLAAVKAVMDVWLTGGVGQAGKNVHISDPRMPYIDADMAEWASRCVDCDEDENQTEKRWDWCTSALSPTEISINRGVKPNLKALLEFLLKKVTQKTIENGQAADEMMKA